MPDTVTLRIQRFNPEADRRPHLETYPVRLTADTTVLDALHAVKDRAGRQPDVPPLMPSCDLRLLRHERQRAQRPGLQDSFWPTKCGGTDR